MASPFSHAVAALSIGTCFYRPQIPKREWVAGAVCSVLPDIDVIGFRFGIHYGDFWGHRGFTHSLVFAALLSGAVALTLFRRGLAGIGRFALFAYLFLATASHGLLDAMTNGGLGVVPFSPFNNNRYFLPWRPIRVSPIFVHRFFSGRGYAVLQSELLWIWVPAFLLGAGILMMRRSDRMLRLKHMSDRGIFEPCATLIAE
jgi:inner membrane protein